MTQPINNYAIGDKLRQITQRSWDARLQDDVTPVVLVNSADLAIEAQQVGLPQAASSQTLKNYSSDKAGTSITAGTGLKILDVTAGKSFYLTDILVVGDGGNINFVLTEGTVGGTHMFAGSGFQGSPTIANLTTPIKFTTALYLDLNATQTCIYSFGGYEE